MPTYEDSYTDYDPSDFDPQKAAKNHPMTASQANDLFSRISNALSYRDNLINQIHRVNASFSDNRLALSIADIYSRVAEGVALPFEDDVDPNTDPYAGVSNPGNTIIRTLDGVSILNSLIKINELDSSIRVKATSSLNAAEPGAKTDYNDTKNGKWVSYKFIKTTDTAIVNAWNAYRDTIKLDTEIPKERYIYHILVKLRDIIKYVKDFTNYMYTVLPNTDGSEIHQNISSAFDYDVLDYIVKIIVCENALLSAILSKYTVANKTADGKVTQKAQEYRQFNGAPFLGSICNAVCLGLCKGSCAGTCNGCGGCTSYCDTSCGGSCVKVCETECSAVCQGGCINTCNGCSQNCDVNCSLNCTGGCRNTCGGNCGTECSGICKGTCNTGCFKECDTGCKNECNDVCGGSCETEASAKVTISNPNPPVTSTNTSNNYYGGPYVPTTVTERYIESIDGNGNRTFIYTHGISQSGVHPDGTLGNLVDAPGVTNGVDDTMGK